MQRKITNCGIQLSAPLDYAYAYIIKSDSGKQKLQALLLHIHTEGADVRNLQIQDRGIQQEER